MTKYAYFGDGTAIQAVDLNTLSAVGSPLSISSGFDQLRVNNARTKIWTSPGSHGTDFIRVDIASFAVDFSFTVGNANRFDIEATDTYAYCQVSGGIACIALSGSIVTTISVSGIPKCDPTGTYCYVADYNLGNAYLYVIDIASNTVVQTINCGACFGVTGLAVDPSNSYVYLSMYNPIASNWTINKIEVATWAVVATGSMPGTYNCISSLAIDPTGAVLYGSGAQSTNEPLRIFDTTTMTSSGSIAGNTATCLAVTPDGLYVVTFPAFGSSGYSSIVNTATPSLTYVSTLPYALTTCDVGPYDLPSAMKFAMMP